MLSYLNKGTLLKEKLKVIHHAMFESHLHYSSLVCPQNSNSIKRLSILQKRSLQLIYFLSGSAHLKFPLYKYFNKVLSAIFENWFTISPISHVHNTCWSNLGCLIPHIRINFKEETLSISVPFIHGTYSN